MEAVKRKFAQTAFELAFVVTRDNTTLDKLQLVAFLADFVQLYSYVYDAKLKWGIPSIQKGLGYTIAHIEFHGISVLSTVYFVLVAFAMLMMASTAISMTQMYRGGAVTSMWALHIMRLLASLFATVLLFPTINIFLMPFAGRAGVSEYIPPSSSMSSDFMVGLSAAILPLYLLNVGLVYSFLWDPDPLCRSQLGRASPSGDVLHMVLKVMNVLGFMFGTPSTAAWLLFLYTLVHSSHDMRHPSFYHDLPNLWRAFVSTSHVVGAAFALYVSYNPLDDPATDGGTKAVLPWVALLVSLCCGCLGAAALAWRFHYLDPIAFTIAHNKNKRRASVVGEGGSSGDTRADMRALKRVASSMQNMGGMASDDVMSLNSYSSSAWDDEGMFTNHTLPRNAFHPSFFNRIVSDHDLDIALRRVLRHGRAFQISTPFSQWFTTAAMRSSHLTGEGMVKEDAAAARAMTSGILGHGAGGEGSKAVNPTSFGVARLAAGILEGALAVFPRSSLLWVRYATVLTLAFDTADRKTARRAVGVAYTLKPALELRYAAFFLSKFLQKTAFILETGQELDVLQVMRFQHDLRRARYHQQQAQRSAARFWRAVRANNALQRGEDIELVSPTGHRAKSRGGRGETAVLSAVAARAAAAASATAYAWTLSSYARDAERHDALASMYYSRLLEHFPNSKTVLRLFASFVATVKNEPAAARAILEHVDQLEDEDARRNTARLTLGAQAKAIIALKAKAREVKARRAGAATASAASSTTAGDDGGMGADSGRSSRASSVEGREARLMAGRSTSKGAAAGGEGKASRGAGAGAVAGVGQVKGGRGRVVFAAAGKAAEPAVPLPGAAAASAVAEEEGKGSGRSELVTPRSAGSTTPTHTPTHGSSRGSEEGAGHNSTADSEAVAGAEEGETGNSHTGLQEEDHEGDGEDDASISAVSVEGEGESTEEENRIEAGRGNPSSGHRGRAEHKEAYTGLASSFTSGAGARKAVQYAADGEGGAGQVVQRWTGVSPTAYTAGASSTSDRPSRASSYETPRSALKSAKRKAGRRGSSFGNDAQSEGSRDSGSDLFAGDEDAEGTAVSRVTELLRVKSRQRNSPVVKRMTSTFTRSMVLTLTVLVACIVALYSIGVVLLSDTERGANLVADAGGLRRGTQDLVFRARELEMGASGLLTLSTSAVASRQTALANAATTLLSSAAKLYGDLNKLISSSGSGGIQAGDYRKLLDLWTTRRVPVMEWDEYARARETHTMSLWDAYKFFVAAAGSLASSPNSTFSTVTGNPAASAAKGAGVRSSHAWRMVMDNGPAGIFAGTWGLVEGYQTIYANGIADKRAWLIGVTAAVILLPLVLTAALFMPAFLRIRKDRQHVTELFSQLPISSINLVLARLEETGPGAAGGSSADPYSDRRPSVSYAGAGGSTNGGTHGAAAMLVPAETDAAAAPTPVRAGRSVGWAQPSPHARTDSRSSGAGSGGRSSGGSGGDDEGFTDLKGAGVTAGAGAAEDGPTNPTLASPSPAKPTLSVRRLPSGPTLSTSLAHAHSAGSSTPPSEVTVTSSQQWQQQQEDEGHSHSHRPAPFLITTDLNSPGAPRQAVAPPMSGRSSTSGAGSGAHGSREEDGATSGGEGATADGDGGGPEGEGGVGRPGEEEGSKETRQLRAVVVPYLTSVSILLAISLGLAGILLETVSIFGGRGLEVNYAGSRRSGTYRLMVLSHELIRNDSSTFPDTGALRARILAEADNNEMVQAAVLRGDASLGLPGYLGRDPQMDALMLNPLCAGPGIECMPIDQQFAVYLDLVRRIAVTPSVNLTLTMPTFVSVRAMQAGSFAATLNTAKDILVSQAGPILARARTALDVLFGISFLLGLLAAVLLQRAVREVQDGIARTRYVLLQLPPETIKAVPAVEAYLRDGKMIVAGEGGHGHAGGGGGHAAVAMPHTGSGGASDGTAAGAGPTGRAPTSAGSTNKTTFAALLGLK